MSEPPTTRGHLTPGPRATVARLPAPDDVAHLVRQLWIPEWDLSAGERVEQLVLGYPASNVVVEPNGVTLHGPTSRASTRVLTGRGWAVGALLRPAGVLLFTQRPADLLDASAPVDAPGLLSAVVEVMADADPAGLHAPAASLPDGAASGRVPGLRPAAAESRSRADSAGLHAPAASLPDGAASGRVPGLRPAAAESRSGVGPAERLERAAALLVEHIRVLATTVPPEAARDGAVANRMVDLVEAGAGVRSPSDLARQLHVSERSLQRLAARYVGMTPQLLLRRRRLQEAAERMRADPAADLGVLAADLGFADQSHLTREFRAVLGATPRGYGRAGSSRIRSGRGNG